MKLNIFVTEAERQRARTRLLLRFFAVMLALSLMFAALLVGRYLLELW